MQSKYFDVLKYKKVLISEQLASQICTRSNMPAMQRAARLALRPGVQLAVEPDVQPAVSVCRRAAESAQRNRKFLVECKCSSTFPCVRYSNAAKRTPSAVYAVGSNQTLKNSA